jgi:hypothetical protein
MRTLLLILLSFNLYAQDTTCIETQRLGRIADTLQHYKQYKQAFDACENVQALQVQQLSNYKQQIEAKDTQLMLLSDAYTEAEKARLVWKDAATNCNEQHTKTFKQLQKAKKARKGWTGAALGFLGALGAGITTTILILK